MKLPEYDNRSSSSYDSSSSEAEDAKFTILGLGLPLALVGCAGLVAFLVIQAIFD